MHIDVIDSVETFTRIKENWDSVYEADPEAQFFLSWTWLSAYLDQVTAPWLILAVKQNAAASRYVAFFPLRLRTKMRSGEESFFYNEIYMAGNSAADYTGFVCVPEVQDHAIPALGKYISKMNWTRLHLENLFLSETRMQLFLKFFPEAVFESKWERFNEAGEIDNNICPHVSLPGDWETYLNTRLSANTRQKARRFLRKIEAGGDEFRITHVKDGTIERDIAILLRFWELKWSSKKGDRMPSLLRFNSTMLRRFFESGSLYLPVLWKGETALGALASLIDPVRKSLLFYIGARDETFNSPPPGFILHAHSIKHAIANGFKTYDFLRGNEPYKYMFGPDERRIERIILTTKSGQNLGNKLDPRSLTRVLQRTIELHRSGQLGPAERGYRQILEVESRYPEALYGLGQLLFTKRDFVGSKKFFRAFVAVDSDNAKGWFKLAECLQVRGELSAAVKAYREAINRDPELPVAYNNLGHVLLKLANFDEALAAFENALKLKPDYTSAEAGRANALHFLPPRGSAPATSYLVRRSREGRDTNSSLHPVQADLERV
jgi:tetratricopeptide (TPR) repeat protein